MFAGVWNAVPVGAGLPAMASDQTTSVALLASSLASQLPQGPCRLQGRWRLDTGWKTGKDHTRQARRPPAYSLHKYKGGHCPGGGKPEEWNPGRPSRLACAAAMKTGNAIPSGSSRPAALCLDICTALKADPAHSLVGAACDGPRSGPSRRLGGPTSHAPIEARC